MSTASLIFFISFAVIASLNLLAVVQTYYNHKRGIKKNISMIPLVGLILFSMAVLNLDSYSVWIWLLVLLDIGTLFLLMALPNIIKEIWQVSRFNQYAKFKNEHETITLYRTKSNQSFGWETDNPDRNGLCGFGGHWDRTDDEFIFYNAVNEFIFKANLDNCILTVVSVDNSALQFQNKVYQKIS